MTQSSINNEITDNNFSISEDTAGTTVTHLVEHTDNTSGSSHARLLAQVGGVDGGDPFIRFNIVGGQDYSLGIDNSDSDILKITDDTSPSTGNTLWALTSSGNRTMPLQSAFYAYNSADQQNVTGNGTNYLVQFNSEIYDQNSDFNTSTYIFTAPVAGRYLFIGQVNIAEAAGTLMNPYIQTTSRAFQSFNVSPTVAKSVNNELSIIYYAFDTMAAGDTAQMRLIISGAAGDTVDITGGAGETFFMGALIC